MKHYDLVPKDLTGNLAYRKKMTGMGFKNRDHAQALYTMCKEDVLYWVNTFVYVFEPREQAYKPFITFPFQDDAFTELVSAMNSAIADPYGANDILIEKSRDEGASYLCLATLLWYWQFTKYASFLLVSWKQEIVDKRNEPKSMFWKLDSMIEKQPAWLRPKIVKGVDRQDRHLRNPITESVFNGESTTENVGAGGRFTAVMLDEFARVPNGHEVLSATRDTTRCRILNSTHKGSGTAFYDMARNSDVRKLVLWWPDDPRKNQGLYCTDDSVDFSNPPARWSHHLEKLRGKLRSPWYDAECKRAGHPADIAENLDIDPMASDAQFFDSTILNRIEAGCRPPVWQGTVADGEIKKLDRGPLRFWFEPLYDNRPPPELYAVGCDIGTGRGARGFSASNSVATWFDRTTGEVVAEYVRSDLLPHDFAIDVVKLCKYFEGKDPDGCFLGWEANGPGAIFGETVLKLGYRNIYYRKREKRLGKPTTDEPGWWTTGETKKTLLGEYRKALQTGETVEKSVDAIREARQYVYVSGGFVAFKGSVTTDDPAEAKDNHGDRIISRAVGWRIMSERIITREEEERKIPKHCFYARRERWKAKQVKQYAY